MFDFYKERFLQESETSKGWDESTMWLYFLIVIVIISLGVLAEKVKAYNPKNCRLFLNIAGIVLTLFLGLRGQNVGSDTISYHRSFANALDRDAFSDTTIETGFRYFCKLCRFFFSSEQFFIFLCSAITIALFISGIKRYQRYIDLRVSLLIFVCIFTFTQLNLMRIYLATSLVFWGFHYLMEDKEKKYCALVILASLVHTSTLVLLLPVFLAKLYERSKLYAAIFCGCLLFFFITIGNFLQSYALLFARYAEYTKLDQGTGGAGIMLFFEFLPIAYILYYIYKRKINDKWAVYFISFTFIAIICRYASYTFTALGRLSNHTAILYVILLPYFLNYIKLNKDRRFYVPYVFLLLYCLVRLHFYFWDYLAGDDIMPYIFLSE